jgi:EAL and modified HD-GYP domain-containing signal transduction protein
MEKSSVVYLARQPVFDKGLEVVAYELLYRTGKGARALDPATQPDEATSSVMIDAVLNVGLAQITGGKPALINVTRSFLMNGHLPFQLSGHLIPEILEGTKVDEDLVKLVALYRKQGFMIALDDFEYSPQWDPLIPLADIIKIDVLAMSTEEVAETLAQLKGFSGKLLAEKVEDLSTYERYLEMGFEYFQGYFLARPNLIEDKHVPPSKLTICKLLGQLADPDIEADAVSETVMQDARLTFKLLKLVNSAALGLPRQLDSIKEAIVLLGLDEIKCWAALLSLALADDKPSELLMTALIRSKMCQLLASRVGQDPQKAFTVGLLSLFEALMDIPMEVLFAEVPFQEEIRLAVIGQSGPLGKVLNLVLLYERGDWEKMPKTGDVDLFAIYREALGFVQAGNSIA